MWARMEGFAVYVGDCTLQGIGMHSVDVRDEPKEIPLGVPCVRAYVVLRLKWYKSASMLSTLTPMLLSLDSVPAPSVTESASASASVSVSVLVAQESVSFGMSCALCMQFLFV